MSTDPRMTLWLRAMNPQAPLPGPMAVPQQAPQQLPPLAQLFAEAAQAAPRIPATLAQIAAAPTAAPRIVADPARAIAREGARMFTGDGPLQNGARQVASLFSTPYDDPAGKPAAAGDLDSRVNRLWGRLTAQESGGRQTDANGKPITSSKGAIGIAQVMPGTAPEAARLAGLPWDEKRYKTDAAYNQALGKAYLRKQMETFGSDELALAAYNAGPGAVSKYGGVPPFAETQNYVRSILGGVDAVGGLQRGYDPRFDQAALGEFNRAEALSKTPASMVFDAPPAPELPVLQQAAPTDFSKSDAAIEAMRPHELAEKDALQVRRDGWFAGLGQALANLPDGAGLGKVLAALGGGAMAGAARGNSEVRARQDRFDEQMVRFNTAVANNEIQKAQTLHQEMQHNAEMANQQAMQQFSLDYDNWKKNNYSSMTPDGSAFLTSKQGPDGKITMSRTPVAAAVGAAFALKRADVLSGMGQNANADNRARAQMMNSVILDAARTGATAEMAGRANAAQQGDPASGIVMGVATMASDAVSTGAWERAIGQPELVKQLQQEVAQGLAARGVVQGSNNYSEQFEIALSERLTNYALQDDAMFKAIAGTAGTAAATMRARRQAQGSTTTKTDPRGRTTTTQEF